MSLFRKVKTKLPVEITEIIDKTVHGKQFSKCMTQIPHAQAEIYLRRYMNPIHSKTLAKSLFIFRNPVIIFIYGDYDQSLTDWIKNRFPDCKQESRTLVNLDPLWIIHIDNNKSQINQWKSHALERGYSFELLFTNRNDYISGHGSVETV